MSRWMSSCADSYVEVLVSFEPRGVFAVLDCFVSVLRRSCAMSERRLCALVLVL